MAYLGELAAGGTAFFWAISALLFTLAGKRIGPNTVNIARLAIGLMIIVGMHWLALGSPFPLETEVWRWGVLALSAILGLVVGDTALFFAFVLIGPRLTMLIMTAVPIFCAMFAWICFDQITTSIEFVAMALTLGAIGWVVSENRETANTEPDLQTIDDSTPEFHTSGKYFYVGIMLSLIGVFGQTANLVVTKYALVDDYSELSATTIRILVSLLALLVYVVVRGEAIAIVRTLLRDSIALMQTSVGALIGPVIGIWLSYIAIEHTKIGVASTIMALPPLLLIPLSATFLDDRITWRSVLGTIVALFGVAVIFLKEPILQFLLATK